MQSVTIVGYAKSKAFSGRGPLEEFNSAFLDNIQKIRGVPLEENEFTFYKTTVGCEIGYLAQFIIT